MFPNYLNINSFLNKEALEEGWKDEDKVQAHMYSREVFKLCKEAFLCLKENWLKAKSMFIEARKRLYRWHRSFHPFKC